MIGVQEHNPSTDIPEPMRLDIGAPGFFANAFAHYESMRSACPVHRAVFGSGPDGQLPGYFGQPLWAITGYAETAALLLDDRFTVDPSSVLSPSEANVNPLAGEEFRPITRNLLSMDPPDHTRLRRLVQPSFTARAIERWGPRIQRLTDDLLDAAEQAADQQGDVAPNRSMELISAFALPLPLLVIFELLGVPPADRGRVGDWSETLLLVGAATDDEELRDRLRAFIAYAQELVAAKRQAPGDDLITHLLQVEDEGDRLDEEELVAMIFLLLVAGHITTVNLIGNGVLALLTHPAELAALQAEPTLIGNVVEESLRYWGPVEVASERFATAPVELDGVQIQRGDVVVPLLGAANRDPARFADPHRFDIRRPDGHRHLAFGKGVHACLGAPLARLEARIALGTLWRRYPDLQLAVPEADIAWQPSFLRSLVQLPVRF